VVDGFATVYQLEESSESTGDSYSTSSTSTPTFLLCFCVKDVSEEGLLQKECGLMQRRRICDEQ
jgi:hypothetical protein